MNKKTKHTFALSKKKFDDSLYTAMSRGEHSKISDFTKELINRLCKDTNIYFPFVAIPSFRSDEFKLSHPLIKPKLEEIILRWVYQDINNFNCFIWVDIGTKNKNTHVILSHDWRLGKKQIFFKKSIFIFENKTNKFEQSYEKLFVQLSNVVNIINQISKECPVFNQIGL